MTTPRLAAALVALAATVAAGCSEASTAPSVPQTTVAATTTVPITPTTASPADVARMALLSPCGMLTDAQIGLFGYTNHSDNNDGAGERRWCAYTRAGTPGQLVIAFLRLPRNELEPSGTDTVSRETIGHHQAWQLRSGSQDLCTVYIDVGGTVVMVQGAQQGGSQQSCIHAETAASKLEPGLP